MRVNGWQQNLTQRVSVAAGAWDPIPRARWHPAPPPGPWLNSPSTHSHDTGTLSRYGHSGDTRGANATRPAGFLGPAVWGLSWGLSCCALCSQLLGQPSSRSTAWDEGRNRVGGGWGPRPSRKGSKAGLGWNRCRRGRAGVLGTYLRKRVQGEGGDGADGQQRGGGGGGGAGPRGGHSTVSRRDQRHLPLQQLQDSGHVCTQPGLQPGARRRRTPWVSGKWRHQ